MIQSNTIIIGTAAETYWEEMKTITASAQDPNKARISLRTGKNHTVLEFDLQVVVLTSAMGSSSSMSMMS
jgi:hypothetical protein